MRDIIYSGKDIVAQRYKGESEFLLITFIGAYHEHAAETEYFWQPYVQSRKINCIGITTRRRSFYRSPEMEDVFAVVDPIAAQYKTILVAGQSMGGYAAIKYSRRLRADYVLAFAPGFSLDLAELRAPSDIDLTHVQRFPKHGMTAHQIDLSVDYTGMGIRPEDCHGKIIAVLDPKEPIDSFNLSMIRLQDPNVLEIRACELGHATANIFNTVPMVEKVVDAVLKGDLISLERLFTSLIRTSTMARASVLSKLAIRKPHLCLQMIESDLLRDRMMQEEISRQNIRTRAIYALFNRTDADGGRSGMERSFSRSFASASVGTSAQALDDGHGALLLSVHGTFLAYNIEQKQIVLHRAVFDKKGVVPVIVTRRDDDIALHIVVGEKQVLVSIGSIADGLHNRIRIETTGHPTIALGIGDAYVRARDDATVDLESLSIDSWEEFVMLVFPAGDSVIAESYIPWFDQVLLTEASSPQQPVYPVSPPAMHTKSGLGWLRRLTRQH